MTDKLEKESKGSRINPPYAWPRGDSRDTDLKKQLEKVDFNLDYGSVKIQIRNSKPTLVTIERTVKLD